MSKKKKKKQAQHISPRHKLCPHLAVCTHFVAPQTMLYMSKILNCCIKLCLPICRKQMTHIEIIHTYTGAYTACVKHNTDCISTDTCYRYINHQRWRRRLFTYQNRLQYKCEWSIHYYLTSMVKYIVYFI